MSIFVKFATAALFVPLVAVAGKLEVFYDTSVELTKEAKIPGFEIDYYQLDKALLLQSEINQLLPNQLESATTFMGQYSNSPDGKLKIKQMVDGYQGVGRAFMIGVRRLPAVVINEKYVIYGTVDAERALAVWREKVGDANE